MLQAQYGNQWAKITKELPGRTDNAVKNRWHAAIRAIMKQKRKELKLAKSAQASLNKAQSAAAPLRSHATQEVCQSVVKLEKSESSDTLNSNYESHHNSPFASFTTEDLYIPPPNVTSGLAKLNLMGLPPHQPTHMEMNPNVQIMKTVVKRGNTVMNTYSFDHLYEEEDIQELLHLTASESDMCNSDALTNTNPFPKSIIASNVPSEITDDYLMKWSDLDSSVGTLTSDDYINAEVSFDNNSYQQHHQQQLRNRSMSLDLKTSTLLTSLEISSKNSKVQLNPLDSLSATGSPYIIAHKRSKTA